VTCTMDPHPKGLLRVAKPLIGVAENDPRGERGSGLGSVPSIKTSIKRTNRQIDNGFQRTSLLKQMCCARHGFDAHPR
jgi:hypothetical protein